MRVKMLHSNVVLLVTLRPILHGSEEVQEKLLHIMKYLPCQTLNGMNQGFMSVLLGMVLETMASSPAQLMYNVSFIINFLF